MDDETPAARADAVLSKLADIAERELPQGYYLELKLARIGSTFEGVEISISQPFEPASGDGYTSSP